MEKLLLFLLHFNGIILIYWAQGMNFIDFSPSPTFPSTFNLKALALMAKKGMS